MRVATKLNVYSGYHAAGELPPDPDTGAESPEQWRFDVKILDVDGKQWAFRTVVLGVGRWAVPNHPSFLLAIRALLLGVHAWTRDEDGLLPLTNGGDTDA